MEEETFSGQPEFARATVILIKNTLSQQDCVKIRVPDQYLVVRIMADIVSLLSKEDITIFIREEIVRNCPCIVASRIPFKKNFHYYSGLQNYVDSVATIFKNTVLKQGGKEEIFKLEHPTDRITQIMADIINILTLDNLNVQVFVKDDSLIVRLVSVS